MRDSIYKMINDVVERAVNMCIGEDKHPAAEDIVELNNELIPIIPIAKLRYTEEELVNVKKNNLLQELKEKAVKLYEEKEAEFPEIEHLREVERVILLKVIDHKWMDHIDDMEQLKQGIGLQGYGGRDPVVEYKFSGYDMFGAMEEAIQEDTVRALMHVRVEQSVEREQVAKATGTNKDDSVANAPKKSTEKKIQPNDKCPCGSEMKYKQCCGRRA